MWYFEHQNAENAKVIKDLILRSNFEDKWLILLTVYD
jgi:hypothetical protein